MRSIIIFLLVSTSCFSQGISYATEEEKQSIYAYYIQHPLDINDIQANDLRTLAFLSEDQITSFLLHRSQIYPFVSIFEIQVINGWDRQTLEKISPFITCKLFSKKWYDLASAKHQLIIRSERTLEEKKGFSPPTPRSKVRYVGDPWTQLIRYRGQLNEYLRIGFLAQKDAGELNLNDFTSFYIAIKPSKWIDQCIIGDFIMQWGQGLIQSGGFSLGKSYESIKATQKFQLGGIPYSSAGETGFYRGIHLQFHTANLTWQVFSSQRNLDASISAENNSFSSWLTDGFHRTPTEISRKNTLLEKSMGMHVHWKPTYFPLQIAYAVVTHAWSANKRNSAAYNQYNWQGNFLINHGIQYQFPIRSLTMAGEFAWANPNAWAWTHSLAFAASKKLDFSALIRNYSPGYFSTMNQALSENSTASNEWGIFIGNQYHITKYKHLASYIDLFVFPKQSYYIRNTNRFGFEILSRYYWEKKGRGNYFIQSKITSKEKDAAKGVGQIRNNLVQISIDLNQHITKKINWHTRAMLSSIHSPEQHETGFLLIQDLKFKVNKITVQGRIAYSNTPSYDTRSYAYEPSLPYAFLLPAYYDQSIRNLLVIEYAPTHNISLGLKIARTNYFINETIGSGYDEIDASHKTDIALQVAWKH